MITNGYLTLDEAQDYIGQPNGSANPQLEDTIEAASRMIDRHCARHFYRVGTTESPAARYFDSRDGYSVDLGHYNDLVSVTTLRSDSVGDGVYETTWSASLYQLQPVGAASRSPIAEPFTSLMLLGGNTFPTVVPSGRRGLIEISGVWGWPSVPTEVKQACRLVVARLFKRTDSPLGVAGFGEFGVVRVTQLDPDVKALLAPYRLATGIG